jgi:hypothetical protein
VKDLAPGEHVDLLDRLVHDAKAAEAAAINNAGEQAQLASLPPDPPHTEPRSALSVPAQSGAVT